MTLVQSSESSYPQQMSSPGKQTNLISSSRDIKNSDHNNPLSGSIQQESYVKPNAAPIKESSREEDVEEQTKKQIQSSYYPDISGTHNLLNKDLQSKVQTTAQQMTCPEQSNVDKMFYNYNPTTEESVKIHPLKSVDAVGQYDRKSEPSKPKRRNEAQQQKKLTHHSQPDDQSAFTSKHAILGGATGFSNQNMSFSNFDSSVHYSAM